MLTIVKYQTFQRRGMWAGLLVVPIPPLLRLKEFQPGEIKTQVLTVRPVISGELLFLFSSAVRSLQCSIFALKGGAVGTIFRPTGRARREGGHQ